MADISVTIESNADLIRNALPEQIEQALTAIGMTAESHAKDYCPVDTGRLRNSITYGVDMSDNSAVIGTNVEYAEFVEMGTSGRKPKPYLRPAAANHTDEYRNLVEQALKGG